MPHVPIITLAIVHKLMTKQRQKAAGSPCTLTRAGRTSSSTSDRGKKASKKYIAPLVKPVVRKKNRSLAVEERATLTCPRCTYETLCCKCHSCARCGWECYRVVSLATFATIWSMGTCKCRNTMWHAQEFATKAGRVAFFFTRGF